MLHNEAPPLIKPRSLGFAESRSESPRAVCNCDGELETMTACVNNTRQLMELLAVTSGEERKNWRGQSAATQTDQLIRKITHGYKADSDKKGIRLNVLQNVVLYSKLRCGLIGLLELAGNLPKTSTTTITG